MLESSLGVGLGTLLKPINIDKKYQLIFKHLIEYNAPTGGYCMTDSPILASRSRSGQLRAICWSKSHISGPSPPMALRAFLSSSSSSLLDISDHQLSHPPTHPPTLSRECAWAPRVWLPRREGKPLRFGGNQAWALGSGEL